MGIWRFAGYITVALRWS